VTYQLAAKAKWHINLDGWLSGASSAINGASSQPAAKYSASLAAAWPLNTNGGSAADVAERRGVMAGINGLWHVKSWPGERQALFSEAVSYTESVTYSVTLCNRSVVMKGGSNLAYFSNEETNTAESGNTGGVTVKRDVSSLRRRYRKPRLKKTDGWLNDEEV